MNKVIIICFFVTVTSCGDRKTVSSEMKINSISKQDSIFTQLLEITQYTISEEQLSDSLSFLILPVQASCPSCLEKSIDSFKVYEGKLSDKQFIIISADGGRKTMNYYFLKQDTKIPVHKRVFLDSTNLAGKFNLYENNPAVYYTSKQRPYMAVLTMPATIKQDLHNFFRGNALAK